MEFPYMEAVVCFMILMYLFETYLDLRQHAALKLLTLPKTLEGVISQEKFEKSRAYSLDKSYFHFVHEFFSILTDSSILFFGILPWFWKKSGNILPLVGLGAENEIPHTLAFLAGVMIWSQITDLPFSLYSTFVIEARHGFNKQTIWLFFRDLIKGMCLAIVLGPPIVSAIIVIVQKGGPYLAIYLWAFIFVLSLVMMTIYPVLIAPLFNKFTPLPEGDLRLKIEKLASSLSFPLKKLFVVDGSTRSSHSNAMDSKKAIGTASLHNGLYALHSSPSPCTSFSLSSFTVLEQFDDVLLWHFRLSHSNFQYLSKLYPSLFINKNSSLFKCHIYPLAKQTKASYLPSPYKPSHFFSLIHSAIWGPSRVKNADGSK